MIKKKKRNFSDEEIERAAENLLSRKKTVKEKVYCKDCVHYAMFEYSKCRKVKKEVDTPYERYPSFYECMDLNAKNDCKYYKKAPAFIRFVRRCFT